jgi:hypothetical protein
MDKKQFTTSLNKFKQVLSEETLNELGKEIKFTHRLRKISKKSWGQVFTLHFGVNLSLIVEVKCEVKI